MTHTSRPAQAARARSIGKGWFGGGRASETAERRPVAAVEALEGRRLLSGTVVSVGGSLVGPVPPVVPVGPVVPPVQLGAKGYGVNLNLTAGQTFNGYLGVLIGAKAPTGDKVAASIDWGDGSAASAGVVTVTKAGHIDVGGSHTYAAGGNFAITVTVTAAPVAVPGQPTPQFILSLGTIHSNAVVSPTNSTGGPTLRETAGVPFTATLGTFTTIAPATNLNASINWGDGTTSAGTITATGVIGIDVIRFKVDGTHAYAKAGTFPIVVTVTQSFGPPGSLTPVTPVAPVRLVATLHDTAIVSPQAGTNLGGTITGTYSPAPTAVDVGALFLFTGSGTAGALGPVGATGRVQLPGFVATGHATGTLTLTQAAATPLASPAAITSPVVGGNSVTLALTGPAEQGFGPFPATLNYAISGGTGTFTNASGTGTIDVTFVPGTQKFTFVIHSS